MRVRDTPFGGARIAWSCLAGLLAAVMTGIVIAIVSSFSGALCADEFTCQIGVLLLSSMVGGTASLGLMAYLFRLGWEWWAVGAGIVLSLPWWFNWMPLSLGIGILVATPVLAGLVTWSGSDRGRWRPWIIGLASLTLVIITVVAVARG